MIIARGSSPADHRPRQGGQLLRVCFVGSIVGNDLVGIANGDGVEVGFETRPGKGDVAGLAGQSSLGQEYVGARRGAALDGMSLVA